MKTTLKTACIIEAKTMSIRRSIFITILEDEMQTASVYKVGTIWKDDAPRTPRASKKPKNRAEVCPKRIATKNAEKTEGIMTGSVNGFWKIAFFIPKDVEKNTRTKSTHSKITSLISTFFRSRTGLKSTTQSTETRIK